MEIAEGYKGIQLLKRSLSYVRDNLEVYHEKWLKLQLSWGAKPTKAPHQAPTSVRNVASYSRIRRVSKSIKPPRTSGNKTYQPPLDSGLATLTPDVRPVNQGCSIPSISSTNNGYKHIIKQPMTCKTKHVCYLINCKKCHKQYTGETQLEFHKRMNNHTSDIRHKKKSTGMVRHFAKCDLNNVQPIILERVRSSDLFI